MSVDGEEDSDFGIPVPKNSNQQNQQHTHIYTYIYIYIHTYINNKLVSLFLGYMATVSSLAHDNLEWLPGGVPLTAAGRCYQRQARNPIIIS